MEDSEIQASKKCEALTWIVFQTQLELVRDGLKHASSEKEGLRGKLDVATRELEKGKAENAVLQQRVDISSFPAHLRAMFVCGHPH